MSTLPATATPRSPMQRPATMPPLRGNAPAAPSAAASRSAVAFGSVLDAVLATNGNSNGIVPDVDRLVAPSSGEGGATATFDELASLLGLDEEGGALTGAGLDALSPDEAAAAAQFAVQLGALALAPRAVASAATPATPATPATERPGEATNEGAASPDIRSSSRHGAEGRHTARAAAAAASGSGAASSEIAGGAAAPTETSPRTERMLESVDPELRSRLQRVMERMRDEFGAEVEVTEGYRSQARQEMLHAQGRTAPGPVVTWTRNSRHTMGRAVDVTVNGGYTDTRGFAALQRVAREEGLHTLGMRDPGHLELPSAAGGAGRAAGASGGVELAALARLASDAGARVESVELEDGAAPPSSTPTARQGGVAQVATVATAARVAQVAGVARTARVATPGAAAAAEPASHARQGRAPSARATGSPGSGAAAPAVARAGGDAAGTGLASELEPAAPADAGATAAQPRAGLAEQAGVRDGRGRRDGRDESQAGGAATGTAGSEATVAGGATGGTEDSGALLGGAGVRERAGSAPAASVSHLAGAGGADALGRLDRIDALREGSAARPLSHLTLTLEDAAGHTDRIRVDVRGSQAGAVLELSDPVLRERVSSNLGELQSALEQRGLQGDALQVRRAGVGAAESLDMSRIAGASLERDGVRASGNSHPGQQSAQQREREGRHPSDGPRDESSPRQRSRREPEENPK